MTNEEKLNEQIKDVAEAFKNMFTKEELEKLQKDFEEFQTRMLEQSGSKDTE
jgi:predicted  nucleic acid-binding Zn-ribbon protein